MSKAPVSMIVAMDKNRAIGFENQLLWHLPDDLKNFKRVTLDHTILMGRRTAQSLGRALPNRVNLVLTRGNTVPFEGMQAVQSIDQALALAQEKPLMVIGGGEIYTLALAYTQTLYITIVDTQVEHADVFFPALDFSKWLEVSRVAHGVDDKHAYAFDMAEYRRANAAY